MKINKKGVIDNLNPLITGLVIVGMLLAIAFLFFAEVKNQVIDMNPCADVGATYNATNGSCNSSSLSYTMNASGQVTNAAASIPGWLPIIIIVVIGALLIGLVQLIRRN